MVLRCEFWLRLRCERRGGVKRGAFLLIYRTPLSAYTHTHAQAICTFAIYVYMYRCETLSGTMTCEKPFLYDVKYAPARLSESQPVVARRKPRFFAMAAPAPAPKAAAAPPPAVAPGRRQQQALRDALDRERQALLQERSLARRAAAASTRRIRAAVRKRQKMLATARQLTRDELLAILAAMDEDNGN